MAGNFKQLMPLFPSLAIALAVSGCQFQNLAVKNGKLPSEAIPYAEKFVGTYAASVNAAFSPTEGTVQIQLEGHRLKMTSTMDVVSPNCGSAIGNLEEVELFTDSNGKTSLDRATFALNPGQCQAIEGREAVLSYNKTIFGSDNFQLSVLLRQGEGQTPHQVPARYQVWNLTKIH